MQFFEYCTKDEVCEFTNFTSFSFSHIIVLLVSFSIIGLIFYYRKAIFMNESKNRLGIIVGIVLLFLDISFYVWKWINNQQPYFPIPMHLCSWATYIVALSLFIRNEKLFQVAFYYGVIGGLLSLIEPGFGGYNFTHMRFYQFFLLHLIILAAPIYQYFAYKWKLEVKWMFITLVIMFTQAGIAAFVNVWTMRFTGVRGNGMFVYEPPIPLPVGTPWYLFLFAILFFIVWYGIKKLLEMKRLEY